MRAITFLIKPASSLCDMHCKYCFYDDVSNQRHKKNLGIMSHGTADRLVQSAFSYAGEGGFVQFLFQGGEPTLAGLDFFQDFLALELEHPTPGIHVNHSIQTNGRNLDSSWADFFRKNQFFVGLSLDGTKEIHDSFRTDSKGQGSWDRTIQALSLLDEYRIETNLLCVITGPIAQIPEKVYQSLKGLGPHPLQFIPCLDPLMEERGLHPYSLTPRAYGDFLKGLLDCWYSDWISGEYVSIRFFDDCIRLMLGMTPSSCAAAGHCGNYLAAEGDGSLYPCDFFVLDNWCLGNIHTVSVEEALSSPTAKQFSAEASLRPAECPKCPYFSLCRGGCKRDWIKKGALPALYYCESMKSFYSYALPRLGSAARQFARMMS